MKHFFIGAIVLAAAISISFIAPNSLKQAEKKVTLVLSVTDAQTIVTALSKLPYDQSAPIIQEIITQVNVQLQPTPPVPAPQKVDTTKKKK